MKTPTPESKFEVGGIRFKVTSFDDRTVAVAYKKYKNSVVIPSTVDYNGTTYSVTSICDEAFYKREELTSIVIPDSVTKIGNWAFCKCNGLTSIEIPDSVTEIGDWAFHRCSGLTSIEIPNSVTKIGNWAFDGCSRLTNIEIPNSVTKIGYGVFVNCHWLNEVIIADGTEPLVLRAIFHNCPLEKLYLGRILKINIQEPSPFYGTTLREVTIGNSVTSIEKNVFFRCSGLTSIEIPDSVTEIGENAFAGCTGLTRIVIPYSVTKIGQRAFSGCSALTSIVIPNNVSSIGGEAFADCSRLNSIKVESENRKFDSRDNCNAIIKTENNTLIVGCQNTKIPSSVISIGYNAFYMCRELTCIEIPNSVTTIKGLAFAWCRELTSIVIPDSVTEIGADAFRECSGLKSIEIPDSVTSIGERVFADCSRLNSIKVESGNRKYDSRDNCNAIIETETNTLIAGCQNTVIPKSVTSIENFAFSGCKGLTNIEIPDSVTEIGDGAFYKCRALNSIISHIPADKLFSTGWSVFEDTVKKNCTLYVPKGAKDVYAKTDGWRDFENIVELKD